MQKFLDIESYFNWHKLQYVPKHKISYLEFGDPDNKNVLVCAHALTRNAYDFNKLGNHLSDSFRVIAITYPGHGNSEYFSNKKYYNYPSYIKDSIKLLKKLDIEKPIWLGTSMGGIIGMAISSRHKGFFKGLILNDIGPEMPAKTVMKIKKYAAKPPSFDTYEAAKAHLKFIYSAFGIKEEADWDYITKHSFRLNEQGKLSMSYDTSVVRCIKSTAPNITKVDLWKIWDKIDVPIMIIHGKKSDILKESTIKKMQEKKSFSLLTIDDAGHSPALLEQNHLNSIKSWLAQLVI